MKSLKLFAVPFLAGAALLASCGAKPIDVKEFRTNVEEKFNLATISSLYVGKKQHITGTVKNIGTIEQNCKINSVTRHPTYGFYRFGLEGETSSDYDVLSPSLIDYFSNNLSVITFSYFISGDTYTAEGKAEGMSVKYIWNKDLVITHSEEKTNGEFTKNLNFKYEE